MLRDRSPQSLPQDTPFRLNERIASAFFLSVTAQDLSINKANSAQSPEIKLLPKSDKPRTETAADEFNDTIAYYFLSTLSQGRYDSQRDQLSSLAMIARGILDSAKT